jgi:7-carboxy-7-deazaguanine synthase
MVLDNYQIMSLMISEIFRSIQGETVRSGFPSLFIRLSGCNLHCAWCDTRYARSGGKPMSVQEIVSKAEMAGFFNHITVTGGEPLCQEETPTLLHALRDQGYSIQVETNGSLPVSVIPSGIRKIVDVKTPSSGEDKSFSMTNLEYLVQGDELKFVLWDIGDYEYTGNFIEKFKQSIRNGVILNLSPARGGLTPDLLAEMMLRDEINARLNLQIHPIIWPEGEKKDL